jgi:hypothetical protein
MCMQILVRKGYKCVETVLIGYVRQSAVGHTTRMFDKQLKGHFGDGYTLWTWGVMQQVGSSETWRAASRLVSKHAVQTHYLYYRCLARCV